MSYSIFIISYLQIIFQMGSSPSHLDNNELLINDRDQYLETGELSEPTMEDSIEQPQSFSRTDVNDSLPPPGLRRMVPGQLEHSESWGNNNLMNYNQEQEPVRLDSSDTLPPPGLRRMVPGQIEKTETRNSNLGNEPISGFTRMVFGQLERISTTQLSPASDNVR